jgi:gelsolin
MIELDEKLGGTCIQHRETQERESTQFLGLFSNKITYLEGGVTSGFTFVEPCTLTEPHLFQIKGTKKSNTLRLIQVPVQRHSLNDGDVFVLAAGEANVWLWLGKESNIDEKDKGRELAAAYCTKGTVTVLEQGVSDGETQAASFWAYLPGKVTVLGPIKRTVHTRQADDRDDRGRAFCPVLYRIPEQRALSDGGDLVRVARARPVPVGPTAAPQLVLPRSKLQSRHAYLLDTGFHVYIWQGSQFVSATGKANAVPAAHQYMIDYDRPMLPMTILKEHQEVPSFQKLFHEEPSGCACTLM